MIPLHQGIDGDAFIPFFIEAFSCHHEGHLTRLEVEIYWSEHGDHCLCWVRIIIRAVLSLNVPIEITLWHSVQIHIRLRQIWHNSYNEFTISQNVCLRQVVSQAQCYLQGTCFPHWQLYSLNHWVQSHLSDVARRRVDFHCLSVSFHKLTSLPVSRKNHVVVVSCQRSSERNIEGNLV